jgi:hypothetical protein
MWSYYHIKLHDMGSKQLDYTFKHINIKGIIEHGSTNLWPTPSSMDEAKLFFLSTHAISTPKRKGGKG